MKKALFLLFSVVLCMFSALRAQDGVWLSTGAGLGFSKSATLMHADLSVTYLRLNRLGFSGNLQSNGRFVMLVREGSVKSYSGGGLQFAWNLLPFDESGIKLIARAGATFGSGYYLNYVSDSTSQSGTASNKNYDLSDYRTAGGELSVELLGNYRDYSAIGIQLYLLIHRFPIAGFTLRYSFGGF